MSVIPAAFLFRYSFPVLRADRLPRSKPPLLRLPDECEIPWPSQLDDTRHYARLFLGWNPAGLAVTVDVQGKAGLPYSDPEAIASSDSVQVWIDTRDTQDQHRGSRFCHHFVAFPTGGGEAGTEPAIRQLPVARAREDAPQCDPDNLLVEADARQAGYSLRLWLPSEVLHGFDPAQHPRLGFMLFVQDSELGPQPLTVGLEFPFDSDPSLWTSLQLAE
jgi:hypothetical protein